ncbi:Bug family tripartite tricarboxylate transporter substrate binding protein [Bordetella petrii]|uniref:Tripartite tricarboxylate transporter substrate binding protein n=1 Tax=Bordetella petrii TaxID=94624 RepID=A0ABT7W874_9BORD|nr:tripartite tricarboxylate transporter substrate binding protein [Bordetella petrii]MDM9561390.1 tripartite tricarboxylate transporter substrate binding protein [Bordetella petrii]
MKRILGLAVMACFLAGTAPATAAYPAKPVKIVVPFTPGGATDAVARHLARKLAERLGQPFIVENRPGASTIIGAQAVAEAAPDGYTLMLSGSTTYTVLPALKKNLPYSPLASFAPLAIVALAPVVLLAKNDLPAGNAAELAALARQRSGQAGLMYGTFGAGSAPHLAGEMFAQAAGAALSPVPYKGSAQLVTALIGGEIDLGVDTVSSAAPHVKAGKVRAIAVTGSQRAGQLPDVPTFTEAGMPSVSLMGWYGLAAPAGTPAPVLSTLEQAVAAIMQDAEIDAAFSAMALQPVAWGPAAFRRQIGQELQVFGDIGARAAISLD